MNPSHSDCVAVLAGKAVRTGTVVVDAGAGDGAWTKAALAGVPGIEVHCFEPDPVLYRRLLINLAPSISSGQVIPHNASIGWENKHNGPAWASLKQYADAIGQTRLPMVRLGSTVPVTAGLVGCEELIRRGHLEFLLATADAQQETALGEVIHPHRYEMFRHPGLGDQVLCASDRFRATIKNQPPTMPDVLELCREFGISPKGVVHVGAHEGHEAARYVKADIKKTLMVEANPAVYSRLQGNVAGLAGVLTINCAASDQNGTTELRITNADQSSSILPLARHSAIYPSVRQTSVVTVPTRTIDEILKQTGQNPADYNLLNLDIQGAELMALKGAINLLPNVQAILTEVNYEELYAGCALIEELDSFLEQQGFDRVATATPYHPSWGDAFYVRRRAAATDVKVSPQAQADFLYNARTTLVGGWLSLPSASLREAWEGATGIAHRHLVDNGVCQLPLQNDDDHRVLELLEKSLDTAGKDRRLQLMLALLLYVPANQLNISTEGMPGWLRKTIPGLGQAVSPLAA